MKFPSYLALLIAGALVLAACGSSNPPLSSTPSSGDAAPASTQATEAAPSGNSSAASSETDLGTILVGPDGKTLYGFTNDTEASSTCYGTCAEAWPPVIVDENWTVAPGLDAGVFATTERDDGQLQLVAGKWPLYWYAADTKPGDVTGQGSGDVWFVVTPEGALVKDEAGGSSDALASTADTELGSTLVDQEGLTLYGFTNDTDGKPSCVDDCADAWPPLLVDGESLPDGLDPEVFSVVKRPDDRYQLAAGKWPLYTFAADANPGDIAGQGSGDVWFAVKPDGSLYKGDAGAETQSNTNPAESPAPPASGY